MESKRDQIITFTNKDEKFVCKMHKATCMLKYFDQILKSNEISIQSDSDLQIVYDFFQFINNGKILNAYEAQKSVLKFLIECECSEFVYESYPTKMHNYVKNGNIKFNDIEFTVNIECLSICSKIFRVFHESHKNEVNNFVCSCSQHSFQSFLDIVHHDYQCFENSNLKEVLSISLALDCESLSVFIKEKLERMIRISNETLSSSPDNI